MSGWRSFYNHFDRKEELFQAAVDEVLDELGAKKTAVPSASKQPSQSPCYSPSTP
jgi:AcrR family transcriptional regulator